MMFDFQVVGWSRSRKSVPGVKSYAGPEELPQFLGQCDFLVCMLPLTPETEGILNAKLLSQLPRGAWLINVGRGGHGNEAEARRDILGESRNTFVVWHHGLLPHLVRGFPIANGAQVPDTWPADRFDMIWILRREPQEFQYTFSSVDQRLLSGDVGTDS
jgi:hypothetical protein